MEENERNDEMYDVVTETEVSIEDGGFTEGTVALVGAACLAIGAAGSWVAKKAKRLYDEHKAKKAAKEPIVDAKPGDYQEVESDLSEDEKKSK